MYIYIYICIYIYIYAYTYSYNYKLDYSPLLKVLRAGLKIRVAANTKLNTHSSRLGQHINT